MLQEHAIPAEQGEELAQGFEQVDLLLGRLQEGSLPRRQSDDKAGPASESGEGKVRRNDQLSKQARERSVIWVEWDISMRR